MDIKAVGRAVEDGVKLGYRSEPADPAYVGWVLLYKVRYSQRIIDVLESGEAECDDPALERERRDRDTPYIVWLGELRRDVHEGGGYEAPSDYRRNEAHRFATMGAAIHFLHDLGYSLESIQEARELDIP